MKLFNYYLEFDQGYSTSRFILESALISFFGKFLIGILVAGFLLFNNISVDILSNPDYLNKQKTTFFFAWLFFLGPAVETFLFQYLPIIALRKKISNVKLIVGIDAALFVLAHSFEYGFIKMFTTLPGAIILAWSFLKYSWESFGKAFLVTVSIHIILNLALYSVIYF